MICRRALVDVYKRKEALEIWRKSLGGGGARESMILICLIVTIVWEEYISEDDCVTKRASQRWAAKNSQLHFRNLTLLRTQRSVSFPNLYMNLDQAVLYLHS
jgi:hypothetical protein